MTAYFQRARREILPHVPPDCRRVLDLGCGAGTTLALLREAGALDWAGGVELDAGAAGAARAHADRIWQCRLEDAPLEEEIPPASLDLVLCLDILEHLVDPWTEVRRIAPLVRPGGRLLVSVPNVRNWKFLWRLFARGDFHYTDAGILDRTHLRFFTPETAVELACAGGFRCLHAGSATPYGPTDLRRWLIALSGGRLEALIAKQTLVVAAPAEAA